MEVVLMMRWTTEKLYITCIFSKSNKYDFRVILAVEPSLNIELNNLNFKMLHELLLALLGRNGNIITEQDGTFKIDPKLTLISEPEKDILNKICTLGYYYLKIQKFISQSQQIFSNIGICREKF